MRRRLLIFFRGLKEFKKDYPMARCYLFYGGNVPLYLEDITVLPVEQALRNLASLPVVTDMHKPGTSAK